MAYVIYMPSKKKYAFFKFGVIQVYKNARPMLAKEVGFLPVGLLSGVSDDVMVCRSRRRGILMYYYYCVLM